MKNPTRQSQSTGFTLVETVITLAILAVIGLVAVMAILKSNDSLAQSPSQEPTVAAPQAQEPPASPSSLAEGSSVPFETNIFSQPNGGSWLIEDDKKEKTSCGFAAEDHKSPQWANSGSVSPAAEGEKDPLKDFAAAYHDQQPSNSGTMAPVVAPDPDPNNIED